MARKGAFDPIFATQGVSPLTKKGNRSALPSGASGALAAGLRSATRDGLRDIDPDLIDSQGPSDRLGETEREDLELQESLRRYGQLVPVLLRPSTADPERYEIIYGRRRVNAARAIGISIKAIIRKLDGDEAIVAQGQENTARKDLTFIERARFARLIEEDGYSREVAMQALNTQSSLISIMRGVTQVVPDDIITAIGPCPSIGRDRWVELAKRIEQQPDGLNQIRAYLTTEPALSQSSDERFTAVKSIADKLVSAVSVEKTTPRSGPEKIVDNKLGELASIQASRTAVTVKINAKKEQGAFAAWFKNHADEIIRELHDRFQNEPDEKT